MLKSKPQEPEITAYEMVSLHIYARVRGSKPPDKPLRPQHEKIANQILQAIKKENDKDIIKNSRQLYEQVCNPNRITTAFYQVQDLHINRRYHIFHLVMGALQKKYGKQRPAALLTTSLEDALIVLLLALTSSEEKVIHYTEEDPQTQNILHKAFSISAETIQQFLEPFMASPFKIDIKTLLDQTLIIRKQRVFGFPAGKIKYQHDEKMEIYHAALAEYQKYEAQRKENTTPNASYDKHQRSPKVKAQDNLKKAIQHIEEAYCTTQEEKQAFQWVSETEQIKKLEPFIQGTPVIFEQKLQELYRQKLSPEQAQSLAKRMVNAFQEILKSIQELGGKHWMKRWQKSQPKNQGKQNARAELISEQETTQAQIDTWMAQIAVQRDKKVGKEQLQAFYNKEDDTKEDVSEPFTKAHRLILTALAEEENLMALCSYAIADDLWEQLPPILEDALFALFEHFHDQDMIFIEEQWTALGKREGYEKISYDIFLALKHGFMELVRKHHHRNPLTETLEMLRKQQQDTEARQKFQSYAYLRTPAGKYAQIQQATLS